ncbi:MAG: Wzz/FepE/Etk N-terminal domain-containing protein [Streptosporangiaceae bacterium]
MTISSRPASFELGDYLSALRRHLPLILVLTIAGALAGVGYAKAAPKTYTANALVQVAPLPNNANQVGGRTAGNVNMDNEAQALQSGAVASLAARQLHSPLTPQQLVKTVTATVPPNSTFLQVGCSASSAAGAARCANAFASAYLLHRRTSAASVLQATLTSVQARIAYQQGAIQRLKVALKHLHGPAQRLPVQLRLSSASLSIKALQATVASAQPLLQSLSHNNAAAGSIVTTATPPTSPSSPRLLLLGPSGLLIGLLIGLVLAFWLDRRDKRVHSVRDVERYLDVPVLLDAAPRKSGQRFGLASPRSRTGQAFTELAQYIATSLGEGSHVLLVAGTAAGAGGSVAAANLAATLARTRGDVILLCSDLTGTMTPALFGVSEGRGLAEVLAGTATVTEVMRRPAEVPRLRIIPPGADTSSTLLNMQHDSCRRMLAELRHEADFVIIEAQSVGYDAETFTLAEFADVALLAIEAGRTLRPDAADCLRRLDRLRAPVLGAVVLPRAAAAPKARRAAEPAPAGSRRPERTERPASWPESPASPRPADTPARAPWRGSEDPPAPSAAAASVADSRPLGKPAGKTSGLPGQAEAGRGMRNHGETRPLPRMDAAAPPKLPRDRTEFDDPPNRVAGG